MSGIIRTINNDEKLNEIVLNRTRYLTDVSIHERLFNIKNNFFDKPICSICNVDFLEWNFKYKISLKIQAVTSYHMLEYHFYDRVGNEIDLA